MNTQQMKASQIVATGKITGGAGEYLVPSQSGAGMHRVVLEGLFPGCTCADFETTGRECKHMLAVKDWLGQQILGTPAAKVDPAASVPRPTYKQDWPKYNLAQTTEKNWFLSLLADLCASIPDPNEKRRRGQQPVYLPDAVYAAVYKVYSGFSARRFTCDLEDAATAGHITKPIHFNSVLKALEGEAMTPILTDLITRSALPLRAVETEWAVDSSGFSGCRHDRWFDERHGTPRSEHEWVKAHVICGTRTNVIAAAEVLDKDSGDAPQLPKLIEAAARGFKLVEVAADKAYTTTANYDAVDKIGGTLYAAFKSNASGASGGVFGRAFHFFGLHREEFLRHYHRRSMIESTFSMIKRKHGDSVKAKGPRAMKNEVLAKFVCHNVCCLISAMYERGIEPSLIGLEPAADDSPRSILKFPGA